MKLFSKQAIDVEDLVFDITVVLMLTAIETYVPPGGRLHTIIHPWALTGFLVAMGFLSPLYLAQVYASYRDRGNRGVAAAVLILALALSLALTFALPLSIMIIGKNEAAEWFMLFNGILGLPAVIIAWVYGTKRPRKNRDIGSDAEGMGTYFTILTCTAAPFAALMSLIGGLKDNDLRLIVLSVILIICMTIVLSAGKNTRAFFGNRLFRFYIFPFTMSVVFAFSIELLFDMMEAYIPGTRLFKGTLVLIVAGYIPIRVLILFEPPIRPINFAIGAASMAYALWTVVRT